MHAFLIDHRDELIRRCREKVALRPKRRASRAQLAGGVPLFVDELIRTLTADEAADDDASTVVPGDGGDIGVLSEVGVRASAHGKVLLELGFTVEQVVLDYGDLGQTVTDLAYERTAPFSIQHYRTLNRCLDHAIADAVAGFADQRDTSARQDPADGNLRMGLPVHELCHHLNTATLAFDALESGRLAIGGATAGLVRRSLDAATALLKDPVPDTRHRADAS